LGWLVAGEFLLAVPGAELYRDQHRGQHGHAGGDQEEEPAAGDERTGRVRGARGRSRGQQGEPDRCSYLLAGSEQGAGQTLVAWLHAAGDRD
jgi:hypothetical protein